jgi:hypothetical protein
MKCKAALIEIDTRIVQRGGWKHPPQSRRYSTNKTDKRKRGPKSEEGSFEGAKKKVECIKIGRNSG